MSDRPVRVHNYLVTGPDERRQQMAVRTGMVANWIETRRQTTMVTCFDEDSAGFLAAARDLNLTVEEIEGAGQGEAYRLVVGEPGTGWSRTDG